MPAPTKRHTWCRKRTSSASCRCCMRTHATVCTIWTHFWIAI